MNGSSSGGPLPQFRNGHARDEARRSVVAPGAQNLALRRLLVSRQVILAGKALVEPINTAPRKRARKGNIEQHLDQRVVSRWREGRVDSRSESCARPPILLDERRWPQRPDLLEIQAALLVWDLHLSLHEHVLVLLIILLPVLVWPVCSRLSDPPLAFEALCSRRRLTVRVLLEFKFVSPAQHHREVLSRARAVCFPTHNQAAACATAVSAAAPGLDLADHAVRQGVVVRVLREQILRHRESNVLWRCVRQQDDCRRMLLEVDVH
eukprot:313607-Prymnesium_polylepis.1